MDMTDITKLRRFCYVGSFNPAYTYSKFRVEEHWERVSKIIEIVKLESLVKLLGEVFHEKKLVRRDEATFLLAAFLSARKDDTERNIFRSVVNEFVKTDLELFLFCRYAKMVAYEQKRKHLSQTVRKCVVAWYEQKTPQELANFWLERRGAHGFTHKSLMILCHISDGSIGSKGLSTPFFCTCSQLIVDHHIKASCIISAATKTLSESTTEGSNVDHQKLLFVPIEKLEQSDDVLAEHVTSAIVEQVKTLDIDEEAGEVPQSSAETKKSTGAVPKRIDVAAAKKEMDKPEKATSDVPKKEDSKKRKSMEAEKPKTCKTKRIDKKISFSKKESRDYKLKKRLAAIEMDVDIESLTVPEQGIKQETPVQQSVQPEQLATQMQQQLVVQTEEKPAPELLEQEQSSTAAQNKSEQTKKKKRKKKAKRSIEPKTGDADFMGVEPPSLILAMSQLRTTDDPIHALALIRKYNFAFKLIPRHLLRCSDIMQEVIPRAGYLELLKCWKIMIRRNFFYYEPVRRPYLERLEDKVLLGQENIHPIIFLMYMHKLGMNADLSAKMSFALDDKANKVAYRRIYTESFSIKSPLPPRRMMITINLQDSYRRKTLKNHHKLSLFQATVALAFGYFKRESHVDVFYWSHRPGIVKPVYWTQNMNIYEAASWCNNVKLGKSTQFLTAPLQHALTIPENYDIFLSIVPTAGRSNKGQKSTGLCSLLDQYRERNKNARYIILDLLKFKKSMSYSKQRIENILEICGLDENTTNLIDMFADGRFD